MNNAMMHGEPTAQTGGVDKRALQAGEPWLSLFPDTSRLAVARLTVGYFPEGNPENLPHTLTDLREDVYRTLLGCNPRVEREKKIPELNQYDDVGEVRVLQALRIMQSIPSITPSDVATLTCVALDLNRSEDMNRRACETAYERHQEAGSFLVALLSSRPEEDLSQIGRDMMARMQLGSSAGDASGSLYSRFLGAAAAEAIREQDSMRLQQLLSDSPHTAAVYIASLVADTDQTNRQLGLNLGSGFVPEFIRIFSERA